LPNVILVSLDTTRADRLSCYGHFRRTSPHLDRVAGEGVLFTDHFSPHIPTYPGHTTMLTGKDIYAHQITGQSGTPEPAEGVKMLAELLRGEGYFTAAADNLGRWFARGFDRIETYKWDPNVKRDSRKGEAVLSAALKVIDAAAAQDRPFFLFLHFWDPHTPYLPPAPFDRMFYAGDEKDPTNTSMDAAWEFEAFNRYFADWMPGVTDIEYPKAQYAAAIAYMDACFAHVLTRLDERGLSGDTLLVITADHGEELDEHAHWFDHHGLYDTNLHIPLILRCPDYLPAGKRIGGLTSTLDVTPTILNFLGLGHVVECEKMLGRNLLPLIESPSATLRGTTDYLHITENTWMKKRGIRTHRWKLIVPLETPDLHGNSDIELYHLPDDPGELNNIAQERPDVVTRLTRLMDEWIADRLAATGLLDPLPVQPIPLRHIGKMETAVPDRKRAEGDFIGYDREQNRADKRQKEISDA
jgi:arylsulfatase A-like enzyme